MRGKIEFSRYAPVWSPEGDAGAALTPADGSAEAAQAALKASDVKPTLLGEDGKPIPEKRAEGSVSGEQKTEAKSGEKSEEKKAEGEAAAKPIFDPKALKLPEGFKADDTMLSELSKVISDEKLEPQARAQALVDMHVKALESVNQKITDYWTETNTRWTKEVASDKDIGTGDEKNPLKPEVKAALAKAIDAYGGKELRDALNQTGAGNNPTIIKAFYKMAGKVVEGSHVAGKPAGDAPKTGASSMYPDLPSQG